MNTWVSYFSVIGISAFKFMFGPISGAALGLQWYETLVCTILGMMLMTGSVLFLSSFFRRIEARFFTKSTKKSPFNKRTRWAIKIRRAVGMWGIAFLTPLIFTPPVGAVLAVAFRFSKSEILLKMLVSAVVWSISQVFFFYYLRDVLFS